MPRAKAASSTSRICAELKIGESNYSSVCDDDDFFFLLVLELELELELFFFFFDLVLLDLLLLLCFDFERSGSCTWV